MFNLGGLFVELQAKDQAYNDTLDRARERAHASGQAIEGAMSPELGGKSGGDAFGKAAGQAGASAAQIAAAMRAALAPLNSIGSRLTSILDRVGGTIVTLARRIDSAMKLKAAGEAAEQAKQRIAAEMDSASKVSQDKLSRVQKVILKWGPTAQRAIDAFSGFQKVVGFFRNMGDTAGKTLSQIKGMTFGPVEKSAAGASGAVGTLGKATEKATGAVKSFGREALVALGVFGVAYKLVGFFKEGIKGASDLNEALNKNKEVFGQAGAVVEDQASRMAKAFGLPKAEMVDAAGSLGLFFTGAKQSQESAAALSNQMVKLAADAGSFYNVPLDQALQKIKSGLAGESEPLREFGVFLNEGAVAAEAVRLKLASSTKEVDENAKVMARASLIARGMQTASGDLERTQGDVANQFRAAGGGLSNFATSIGQVLMPAVKSGINAFNEFLASVIEAFEGNRPMIESWAGYLTSAMDGVGLVVRNFPDFWEIAKLGVFENIININEYIQTIPMNLGLIAAYVAENWVQLIGDAFASAGAVIQSFALNVAHLAEAIFNFLKDPTQGFQFEFTPLLYGFEQTAAALPEMVKPHLTSLQGEIDAAGDRIAEREKKRLDSVKQAATRTAAKSEGAAKAKKEEAKVEESGLADFGRKLRLKQLEGKDKDRATADNTEALKATKDALHSNTEVLKKGVVAAYG